MRIGLGMRLIHPALWLGIRVHHNARSEDKRGARVSAHDNSDIRTVLPEPRNRVFFSFGLSILSGAFSDLA